MSQKNDQPSQHDPAHSSYSVDDIEILSLSEIFRKRPGMMHEFFRQGRSEKANHKLLETLVEHMVTHNILQGNLARTIVTLKQDGSATVEDFGVGYKISGASETTPRHFAAHGTEEHQNYCAERYPAIDARELESRQYATESLTLVNASSTSLAIETRRDGKHWSQRFEKGEPLGEITLVGETQRTGTKITFSPDHEVLAHLGAFGEFDFETAARDLERLAWIYPGLRLHLLEEHTMRTFEAYYPTGSLDILVKDHQLHKDQIFSLRIPITRDNKRGIDLAIAWRDAGALDAPANITSMVNNVRTTAHGSHVDGIGAGIMDALLHAAHARSIQWKIPLAERGMVAAIRVQDEDAHRHLEAKDGMRLSDDDIESFVASVIAEHLEPWLEAHPYLTANLLERMASL